MTERTVNGKVQRRKVVTVNVALYPEDLETLQWLRIRHELDSVSQAARRAIRDAKKLAELTQPVNGVAA